ncbi:ionotropic receptor 75a [Augochlora pura]
MNLVNVCLLMLPQLICVLCADEQEIIRDYFTFRKVKRVVGFSCGTLEDDIKLARTFNDMYITYTSLMGFKTTKRMDIKKLLKAEYHRLGVFLDTRCDSKRYTKIFLDATKYSMYDEMHRWLIFGSNLTHSLDILNDKAFSIFTDIVIVIPSMKGYVLYDVYNPCKDRGGSMNVTNFGTWNKKKGLNVTLTQSKFHRRSNLHGMRLKVGVVINYVPENQSLHEMMMEYSMKAKYGRSKYLYVILWHLSNLFNFTMDVIRINPQRRFDHSGPVFEAFKKKTIDLSASPVAMKVDRLNNGDIIGPVWPIRSCFMFRTISSTKIKPAQFLKPLSVKVWYGVLTMIVIVMSILIIFIRLEGVREPADNYGLSVLLTIGALSQQGSAFVPTRCAARIAFLQILIFSTIILNYYSASVVSNRLKNKGEKMNDSLISLAKSGMRLAVEPTPYVRSFLQVQDKDVRYFYQNCWMKIPEYDRYLPLEQGLDQVAKGTLAYHTMVDSAYPYIEHTFNDRSICELTEVHLLKTSLAFYARHRSPFTKLLKTGLTKIRNVGIQKREIIRWSARQPFCPSNLLIAEPLSIHEAAPVFVFLCIAVGFAIIICVIENLIYYLAQSRRANMHGMRLKISGVIQYRPKDMRLEDYMQDVNTRSLDSMHKFVHAMILHTGDLFNFSVHASEIIYWDRHSVHGLIFEFLQSNYIDFASNPRIMVSERLDYASLIGAAWPIRPCFMLLSTSTNKIKLEIFLKPFARQTWYTFAGFGLFSIFVLKMIMNCEGIGKREKYSGALVLSVGIISQQGANLTTKRVASRIALFQITIQSWIMYNYYSGSIVSARLSEPLDMMEDSVTVLADSNLKIAAEAVPYLNYFLYKLNWESDYFRKKRWDPLPESKRYLPIEEGIKQVSEGVLAYHTDPNTAYPYVERMFDSNQICALTEIHLFKQSVMGMYASHNGQFVEMAKIGLTKMFNTGLRDRQIKHWSSRKPQCQSDTLSTRSITIYETAPALILLAFGSFVAGIFCLGENIAYKRAMKAKSGNRKEMISARGSIITSGNSRDNLLDLQP